MPSPTSRSLDLLRNSGFLADVVERWIARINRRRDLFGCFDVLGVHPHQQPGVLLVQCTSIGNLSARVKKVSASPFLATLLAAGVGVECWGWRGSEVKRVALRREDLQPVVVAAPRRRSRRTHEQGELFT